MLYSVYWPGERVLKVGTTRGMRRVRGFMATGALLVVLIREPVKTAERAAIATLAELYPRAFESIDESRMLLPAGRGFTECFTVPVGDLATAIDTIAKGV